MAAQRKPSPGLLKFQQEIARLEREENQKIQQQPRKPLNVYMREALNAYNNKLARETMPHKFLFNNIDTAVRSVKAPVENRPAIKRHVVKHAIRVHQEELRASLQYGMHARAAESQARIRQLQTLLSQLTIN